MDFISGRVYLCDRTSVCCCPAKVGGTAAGSWRVPQSPIYNQIQNFLGERREVWIMGFNSVCCYVLSPFCCPLVFSSRILFCCLWIFWNIPNLCPLLVLVKHVHFRLSLTSDSFKFRIYINLDFLAKGENFKMFFFFLFIVLKLWLHKQCWRLCEKEEF